MTAGHCAKCEVAIWVIFVDPRSGAQHLGWPLPESVYAVVETTLGPAPGIGFHPWCAPEIGEPLGVDLTVRAHGAGGPVTVASPSSLVRALESAGERYHEWYAEWYGDWLTAWLRDHLRLPEDEALAILRAWARDVARVSAPTEETTS